MAIDKSMGASELADILKSEIRSIAQEGREAGDDFAESFMDGVTSGVKKRSKETKSEITKIFEDFNKITNNFKSRRSISNSEWMRVFGLSRELLKSERYADSVHEKLNDIAVTINGIGKVSGLTNVLKELEKAENKLESVQWTEAGKNYRKKSTINKTRNKKTPSASDPTSVIEAEKKKQKEVVKTTETIKDETEAQQKLNAVQKEADNLAKKQNSKKKNVQDVTGSINKQGDAIEKTTKKMLNMETVVKRYNKLMMSLGVEHLTIGTRLSQDTDGWGIKEMVQEAKYQLADFYNPEHDSYIKADGLTDDVRKRLQSEVGRLKRFIAAYEPYVDMVESTAPAVKSATEASEKHANALQKQKKAAEGVVEAQEQLSLDMDGGNKTAVVAATVKSYQELKSILEECERLASQMEEHKKPEIINTVESMSFKPLNTSYLVDEDKYVSIITEAWNEYKKLEGSVESTDEALIKAEKTVTSLAVSYARAHKNLSAFNNEELETFTKSKYSEYINAKDQEEIEWSTHGTKMKANSDTFAKMKALRNKLLFKDNGGKAFADDVYSQLLDYINQIILKGGKANDVLENMAKLMGLAAEQAAEPSEQYIKAQEKIADIKKALKTGDESSSFTKGGLYSGRAGRLTFARRIGSDLSKFDLSDDEIDKLIDSTYEQFSKVRNLIVDKQTWANEIKGTIREDQFYNEFNKVFPTDIVSQLRDMEKIDEIEEIVGRVRSGAIDVAEAMRLTSELVAKTIQPQVEGNNKVISTYDELIAKLNEFIQLKKKVVELYYAGEDISSYNPQLRTMEADLTRGMSAFDAGQAVMMLQSFPAGIDQKALAGSLSRYLGIEIPQAIEKADSAQAEFTEETKNTVDAQNKLKESAKGTSDVLYHAGDLSNPSGTLKSFPLGNVPPTRSNGIGGLTGLYTTDDLDGFVGNEWQGAPISTIDPSAYKLLSVGADDIAEKVGGFLNDVNATIYGYYNAIDEKDWEMKRYTDVKSVEDLYEAHRELFKESSLTFEQFTQFINSSREKIAGKGFADIELPAIDEGIAKSGISSAMQDATDELFHSDSFQTQFIKMLGYEGVDLRGTKYNGTYTGGTVIFDVKPESLKTVNEKWSDVMLRNGYEVTEDDLKHEEKRRQLAFETAKAYSRQADAKKEVNASSDAPSVKDELKDTFDVIQRAESVTARFVTTANTVHEALQKMRSALPDEQKEWGTYIDGLLKVYDEQHALKGTTSEVGSMGDHSEQYRIENLGDGRMSITFEGIAGKVKDAARIQQEQLDVYAEAAANLLSGGYESISMDDQQRLFTQFANKITQDGMSASDAMDQLYMSLEDIRNAAGNLSEVKMLEDHVNSLGDEFKNSEYYRDNFGLLVDSIKSGSMTAAQAIEKMLDAYENWSNSLVGSSDEGAQESLNISVDRSNPMVSNAFNGMNIKDWIARNAQPKARPQLTDELYKLAQTVVNGDSDMYNEQLSRIADFIIDNYKSREQKEESAYDELFQNLVVTYTDDDVAAMGPQLFEKAKSVLGSRLQKRSDKNKHFDGIDQLVSALADDKSQYRSLFKDPDGHESQYNKLDELLDHYAQWKPDSKRKTRDVTLTDANHQDIVDSFNKNMLPQMVQNISESASKLKNEQIGFDGITQSAEKAAGSKKKFAKANQQVGASASDSKDQLNGEAEAIEKVATSAEELPDGDVITKLFVGENDDPSAAMVKKVRVIGDKMRTEAQKLAATTDGEWEVSSTTVTEKKLRGMQEYVNAYKKEANKLNDIEANIRSFGKNGVSDNLAGKVEDYTAALEKMDSAMKSLQANPNDVSASMKFDDAKVEAQRVRSEIELIFKESKKLGNIGTLVAVGDKDVSKLNNIKAAMREFADQTWDGEAKVSGFNKKGTEMYVVLDKGEGAVENITVAFDKATGRLKAFATGTSGAAQEWAKFKGQAVDGAKRIAGMYLGFSDFVRYAKQGVDYVKEIDLAMTELKKVTNETGETYKQFLDGAGQVSAVIGSTVSDFTEATATFARLGYTLEESSSMAETAIIYKNVADGMDSVEESSDSIISTMLAFGIEANNTMSIVDKYNEVGNRFAITSAGIGEALQRSASALFEAGNTIDESIALVTAANSVVDFVPRRYSNIVTSR